MKEDADTEPLPGEPLDDRPNWPTPGTVGVTTTGSDSDATLRSIQREVMDFLEVSGISASAQQPRRTGAASTGVLFYLAVSFIVEHAGEAIVLGGLTAAAKKALHEKKRREMEALDRSLPAVLVHLEDARDHDANVLWLVEILGNLQNKLAEVHPNRRYSFVVRSKTSVIPAVTVTTKASDLSHSVRTTIAKLLIRYEGADYVRLLVKRNTFGKTIVEAEVQPPVPPFDNPHWNAVSILQP